jgi:cellulose synthase/poly-beta-1,6-N-acetylglucosamine synthase-like glycosyltransferase
MIVYLLVVLAASLAYLGLLNHYAKLWGDTPEVDALDGKKHIVSLLIPFRNEKVNLPRLLASIEEQVIGSLDVEVIFVNDHSTDKSHTHYHYTRRRHRFHLLAKSKN